MTTESQNPIIIYEDADKAVEVRLGAAHETVWLSQRQMAGIFDTSTDNIGLHLKNIYDDDELEEGATTEESSVVRQEGQRQVRRRVKHYNLDAIISVGYRVNSGRAVKFRRWATRVLREHLTQGWTLNHQRFEENAQELEAALALVRKTAQSPELGLEGGRGVAIIQSLQDYGTGEEDRAFMRAVSAYLNDLESARTVYQQKPTALAELKQSLLQKTFSGELTTQKPTPDEALKEEEIA